MKKCRTGLSKELVATMLVQRTLVDVPKPVYKLIFVVDKFFLIKRCVEEHSVPPKLRLSKWRSDRSYII